MLDYRIWTFLDLCDTKNYTRTAELLHITQPAVTQHIHHLEQEYGVRLFEYQGRRLRLTEAGDRLRAFALSVRADDDRIREQMALTAKSRRPVRFGATLTIGEFTMPPILNRAIASIPDLKLTMQVRNTQELLLELEQGLVDFAMVEGNFDRALYETRLFSKEEFIGVCAPDCTAGGSVEELLTKRLITRETGSGTRGILEQALHERNLTLSSFERVIYLGSTQAIKSLVAQGLGITFLYREAVREELKNGSLKQIEIRDFQVLREFEFVMLKNSLFASENLEWFERFCQWR